MYVLYAEFTAHPGRESTVRALIADYARIVRSEPGNIQFDVFEKAGAPGDFFVFEEYKDDESFASHVGSAEGKSFNAALSPEIVGGASRLTVLENVPVTL